MTRSGQPQFAFPPIITLKFLDPAMPGHDVKGASESGAVHRQNLSQPSLMNSSGER